ncbi:MAG: ATP-binding protein [Coriobacteriia bacterium]|nr:ATP-binding protein [Coriobacteriia bacterium]
MKSKEELQKILDGYTYPHPCSSDFDKLWLDDRLSKEEVIELAHMAGFTTSSDLDKKKKISFKDYAVRQKIAGVPAGIWREANVNDMQSNIKAFANTICNYDREHSTLGLLIIGGDETSKTYTACSVINSVIKRTNKTAKYLEFGEFFNKMSDTSQAGAFISTLQAYDVLVIDNVSLYDLHSFKLQHFISLIRARSAATKHTIITTNLSIKEFYGYLMSRANKQMSEAIIKTLNGFDKVFVEKHEEAKQ